MGKELEICIVDDEKIVCDRLGPELERGNFNVETFTDSSKAFDRLKEKNFDVVITDLKMKHPNGIELLEYINANSPQTRVIIITGFATVETARQAMKGGAVDFIAKPFRMSQIRELVQTIAKEKQKG